MKILNTSEYNEKLKIRPVNVNDISDNDIHIEYTEHPKERLELIIIIKKRIDKDGYECDLNDVDVSRVMDMNGLFSPNTGLYYNVDIRKFNGKIDRWNVSNVTDMSYMFMDAKNFNGDISRWDVSCVRDMSYMFKSAIVFDNDISNWNVSKVNTMDSMFRDACCFDQDLSDWDVSSVTNMYAMFKDSSFNHDISKWNVDNVKYHDQMFSQCPLINHYEKQPVFH